MTCGLQESLGGGDTGGGSIIVSLPTVIEAWYLTLGNSLKSVRQRMRCKGVSEIVWNLCVLNNCGEW